MRLGTRWAVGAAAPASVPAPLAAAVADLERERGIGPTAGAWTLTWLEGRPIAELPDGTSVTLGADGRAAVLSADSAGSGDSSDEDDWLS